MILRKVRVLETTDSIKHEEKVNEFLLDVQNRDQHDIHSVNTVAYPKGGAGVTNFITVVDFSYRETPTEEQVEQSVESTDVNSTEKAEERPTRVFQGENLEGLGIKMAGHVPKERNDSVVLKKS